MSLGYDGSIRIDTKINQKGFNQGISGMVSSLGKLAAAVGVAFGVAALVNFGKESVKAASQLSSALIGLQSIVEGQGRSFQQAQTFIQDYIKDGLVPMQNAVTAYKNLAMRGYSTEQIEQTMIALKNSATFGRQASLTMGEAVSSATEGLKNENSILVDNAGVTKNVSVMWKEYAEQLGVGVQSLTKTQKIQAEVNGIMNETRFQMGDAEKAVDTYAGQMARLSFNFTQLKVAVGNAIMPIVQAALPAINTLIAAMTNLANISAQVTIALFGKQTKAENDLAESGKDAANSNADLAGSTDDMGDAVEKAGKKLKGAKAPFDDFNKLAGETASSVEDATENFGKDTAGSGDLFGDIKPSPEILTFIEAMKSAVSDLVDKLREMAVLLKKGFEIGLVGTDLSPMLESISGIGEKLKSIFSDPEVTNATQTYIDHIATMLGTITGSMASIGVSLGTALFGGINTFLEERGEDVKQWIIRMFDVNTEIADLVAEFSATIANIFTVFSGEDAQQIVADIISIFASIFMGTVELAAKLGRDLLDVFVGPIIENEDKIKERIENTLRPLSTVIGAIEQLVRNAIDSIIKMYDEHIHPFLMKIKDTFTEWMGHLLDGWNEYVAPVWDELASRFADIIDKYIGPAVDTLVSVFGKMYDLVGALWDLLSPFITAFIDDFMPEIADALSLIGNLILDVIQAISGIANGIFTALGGVLDFITGVFTGDWERAWKGITDIFKGVFNVVISVLESGINLIISGVNFLIKQINKIKIDVPDWLTDLTGMEEFGFNIPAIPSAKLPRLANGAVIPPNKQFTAVLGDQTFGTNLEAPEGLIRRIVREETAGNVSAPREIRLRIMPTSGFARDLRVELDDLSMLDGVRLVR